MSVLGVILVRISPYSVRMRENTDQTPNKDTFYAVFTIIEKLKGRGRTDQNGMAKSCQPLRKARERYCMIELRTMYTYELNDRYGDEY